MGHAGIARPWLIFISAYKRLLEFEATCINMLHRRIM